MKIRLVIFGMLLTGMLLCLSWQPAEAFPLFARKYKTSCQTCHVSFPKLNAFGRAFNANGYRYPEGTDEDYIKEEPIKLGSDAQKQVFPKAIWPADIAGTVPISFRMISRMHVNEKAPTSSFEFPHEMEVLTAGTVGESFSYFGEIEIEHKDELAYNLFIQYDYRPELHIRIGSIDPMPLPDGKRLSSAHYNFGNIRTVASGVSGGNQRWRYRDTQNGFSLWGRANGPGGRGGVRYAIGVVNGQIDGARNDVNTSKDVFINASYKIGGLGETGGTEGGASASSAFWLDNSARIGGFTYIGKSQYGGFDDRFYVGGTNWDLWYDRVNLFGAYLYQKDKDIDGVGTELTTKAMFTEANVMFYPWLIGIGRYEWTKIGGGASGDQSIIPGVAFMVRPNVRITVQGIIPTNRTGPRDYEYVVQFDLGI